MSARVVAWLLVGLSSGVVASPVAQGAQVVPVEQRQAGSSPVSSQVSGQDSRGEAIDSQRAAILEIARAYANHGWRATEANALHGPDEDGIHVDTPDVSHRDDGFRTDGSLNTGVPYKWGGFSSLKQFDAGVEQGLPAGQLTDGVNLDASKYAVGVDCSGFVARCWNLPFKQSTRSLGRLCFELPSYDELLPGDLINKFDAHAMVFVAFEDEDRSRARVIEAAFPAVKESVYPCASLESAGFRPYRYKPLDNRWLAVRRAPEALRVAPDGGEWIAEGEPEAFEVDQLLEGVDLRSVLDGRLEDGLAAARTGDWVEYRAGNIGGELALEVRRVVAEAGSGSGTASASDTGSASASASGSASDTASASVDRIEIQTATGLGDQSMATLEQHTARSPWAARMMALEDSGQPLDSMRVVSGTLTVGRWVDGGTVLPGHRVELRLQGSMTSRTNDLPLDVRLTVIISPEVPLEGIVSWDRETTYGLPSGPALSTMRYRLSAFGRADIGHGGSEGGH